MTNEPQPPNPYAATDALSHAVAPAAKEPAQRKPSRFGALVLTFLAYPLLGAGLYNLRRPRRFALWAAIGALFFLLMVLGVRAPHPRLAVSSMAGLVLALLASLADTGFAKAGGAPHRAAHAWLVAIALILGSKGVSLAVRQWAIEAFKIPAGSMIPTLEVGDHLFVKKGHANVLRGDVVVFEFPPDRSTDYVKRVVAIGGDTVEVREGVVSINGAPLDQQPLDGTCAIGGEERPGAEAEPCKMVRETNAGRSYTIVRVPDRQAMDAPRVVVPPDNFFVLGDNRDNSYDSRRWGFVPVDHVKGVATVIWWSQGPAGARWSRVGHGIE
jgi:signal peptidase I